MLRRSRLAAGFTLVSLVVLASIGCARSGGGGSGAASSASAPVTSGATPTTTGTSSTSAGATAVAVTSASVAPSAPPIIAGAAQLDITPPIGVPLAGYGGGQRRHPFPNLNPLAFDHFLTPSTGIRDPIEARALFVSDGKTRVVIVTLDAIATTHEMVFAAWQRAKAMGSSVALEDLMVCSSHSHSGPGCLTTLWFWQLTAADLYQDSVFQAFADGIARAIVGAERTAQPAAIGVASTQLTGVSHNRRAGVSHVFTSSSIDPEMLVVRVDALSGAPIATLWNFAIHGVSLDMDSHVYSADIMGGANSELNARSSVVGVPMFVNSAEGDISPDGYYGDTGIKAGGKIMADTVLATRANTKTQTNLDVRSTSEFVDFGQANLDLTQGRLASYSSLTSAGWTTALSSMGIGTAMGIKINFPSGWIETQFRFQAIRMGKWGFASIPGEAIHTIGMDMKSRGKALGFEHVLTCGLANGHMAYITTQDEYWAGGYEALATFWGEHQSDKLVQSSERQMTLVKP